MKYFRFPHIFHQWSKWELYGTTERHSRQTGNKVGEIRHYSRKCQTCGLEVFRQEEL